MKPSAPSCSPRRRAGAVRPAVWGALAVVVAATLGAVASSLPASPALAATTSSTASSGAPWSVGSLTLTPNAQDKSFLVALHQANLLEIAEGRLASSRAMSAPVRAFGNTLVTEDIAVDAPLTLLARAHQLTLPSSPSSAQVAQYRQLQSISGEAFDSAFLSDQVADHASTLATVQQEISTGQASDVIAAARVAQPVVSDHLQQARQLLVPASASVTATGSSSTVSSTTSSTAGSSTGTASTSATSPATTAATPTPAVTVTAAPTAVNAGTGGQASWSPLGPGLEGTGIAVLAVAAVIALVRRPPGGHGSGHVDDLDG